MHAVTLDMLKTIGGLVLARRYTEAADACDEAQRALEAGATLPEGWTTGRMLRVIETLWPTMDQLLDEQSGAEAALGL